MRLKHLTRAAADLRIGPGIAEPISKGSTTPAREHGDESAPVPRDSARLDPGLFALSRPDLLLAAKTLMPMFPLPAAQPSADVGTATANRPGMTSPEVRSLAPEVRSLAPSIPSSVPITCDQLDQGATIANFAPIRYPLQIPSPTPTPATPMDRSGGGLFSNPGAAPPQSAVVGAYSPLSQPKAPDILVSSVGEHRVLHPSQQRAAGAQVDASQGTRAAPYDTSAWAQRPTVDSRRPSAAPPPSEPRSTALHGEIYVDGSRLGRWVTDRFVKAAQLPRAATTGFDPRMTPTWPGAPVGA